MGFKLSYPLSGPRHFRLRQHSTLTHLIAFLQSVPPDHTLDVRHFLCRGTQLYTFTQDAQSQSASRRQESIRGIITGVIHQVVRNQVTKATYDASHESILSVLVALSEPLTLSQTLNACVEIGYAIVVRSIRVQYIPAPDRPPRTPTECIASLLDILEVNHESYSQVQLQIIQEYQRCGGESFVCNETDMKAVGTLLARTELGLMGYGLEKIQSQIRQLREELKKHDSAGPPKTRLVDNVYGRVWESALNAELIGDIPPKLLKSSQRMREAFRHIAGSFTDELHGMILIKFMAHLQRQLPQCWSDRDPRLQMVVFANVTRERFDDFLRVPPRNGYEVAGDYLVVMSFFEAMKVVVPDYFSWMEVTRKRYQDKIIPLKSRPKFHHVPVQPTPGGGITLNHHAPCVAGQPSVKPLDRAWDLDVDDHNRDNLSDNMRALDHGLPHCTSISGYTHLFVSFFLHSQEQCTIDLRHGVLGLLVYLVYTGGHSWNECIRTLALMQDQAVISLFSGHQVQVEGYPSYKDFILLFKGTDTFHYLEKAVEKANREVIQHRRRYVG